MDKKNGRDINDICKLPEFISLRKVLQEGEGAWGRSWNNKKGSFLYGSHFTFMNKNEVVSIYGPRGKIVEDEPLRVVRWCVPGSKSNTIFIEVIKILYKHSVPFITPNEKCKPLNPNI